MSVVLGIDVGGSGIKGALVDLEKGELVSDRIRLSTPKDFGMPEVVKTIARLIKRFKYNGPVGVGFPAAVANGIILTPPTAHEVHGWLGNSVENAIEEASGCNAIVINDADAAGLAEVRFGAGKGIQGSVMTFTLGTGVGCGMFLNGALVPNFELGKLYLQGHTEAAEQYMASRIKEEQGLKWSAYGARLNEYFLHIEFLFSPELIIVGGGVSKKANKFMPYIQLKRTEIKPAELRNEAGIVGAAAAVTR
ncbi:MAG: ROK family protein [Anaerolineales bacterium]|nr:ROK family protein [Anaerolineales bacterium]